MSKYLFAVFAMGMCFSAISAEKKWTPRESNEWFGIWTRERPVDLPWVKGCFVSIAWSELEPRPNEFDWNLFEKRLAAPANMGQVAQLIVFVGPASPRWIYEAGVPEVHTTPTINPRGQPHGWTYPFYLDEDYIRYYHRMIRAVAERIDMLPPKTRKALISLQTAEGTTGDEGGYKGEPLDPRYALPNDKWVALKFETWQLFKDLYEKKEPKIHLLINSGNQGQYHDWLMKNMPDTWRKAGNPGHGYQLNDEMMMFEFLDPIINYPNINGEYIRARSEMDETHKGWFRQEPIWNLYWLNLWGLNFGLDILHHSASVVGDPRFREANIFFSRYAGFKNPATSPGAWIALKDGLDAADRERFPDAVYGDGRFSKEPGEIEKGMERCRKIAESFAAYGARQEDAEKAMYTVMKNRDASAMNDVGWNIWTGNYARYIRQIDPNGTSQGYWRVGPSDQPYGRFARGFDAATGKNSMRFDIDDRFFEGRPLAAAYPVKVRVVYFDKGRGSWALQYDAADDPEKAAMTVRNEDSGRWKEIAIDLADAHFGNRGPEGSDLSLIQQGGEDVLFHMIELTRD